MKLLLSMFEEKPGQLSAARVILFLVFATCIMSPVGVQLHLAVLKGAWQPIDPATADFCKWAFAASLGGKVGQAIFGEKDSPATPPVPAQP